MFKSWFHCPILVLRYLYLHSPILAFAFSDTVEHSLSLHNDTSHWSQSTSKEAFEANIWFQAGSVRGSENKLVFFKSCWLCLRVRLCHCHQTDIEDSLSRVCAQILCPCLCVRLCLSNYRNVEDRLSSRKSARPCTN